MTRSLRPIVATLLGLALSSAAHAAQYQAWGDTGWVYASKRECCDAAITIAQEYSADACVTSGGMPRPPMGGGRRGTCRVDWMQDGGGGMLYRCTGEAALWCR